MTATELRFGMFLSQARRGWYLDYVRRHHRLGFTDFATVRPDPADAEVLRRVATEIIPELRAGRLLD